jgi:hypothetical protein
MREGVDTIIVDLSIGNKIDGGPCIAGKFMRTGMKQYIGVKIVVQAEPEQRDSDDGYKVVFEKHNRVAGALPCGFALEVVWQGEKSARHGRVWQNSSTERSFKACFKSLLKKV